jgi:hypothetical protein
LRLLLVATGRHGGPAGEDVVQQADGPVLLGAFTVQGGLVAGELVAQRGDSVVRGGQLRGGGGEGSIVPLLVLLAGAGSIRAGCPGGVPLGAGRGEGLLRFGDPGCRRPAFAVQRAAASSACCPACWRAAASACIAVMAWAAAARASAASSSAACRATAWAAVSARACSIWAAVAARTASACASAASGSPAAASWAPRAASWSSAADNCAPSLLIAASASSRMAAARLMAAVTGRSTPGWPASWPRRRNAVIAVCRTSTAVPSPRSSGTSCSQ